MKLSPSISRLASLPATAAAFKGLRALVDILSSYGLASVLFLCLLVLTYLGTLDQVENGLHHAQEKYFNSFIVVHELGWFGFLMPGAYLVLLLLFVNISLGVLLRMRKGWAQFGMLMVHGGILVLMVGSLLTFHYSFSGHMMLFEGDEADHFKSYYDWEIAVKAVDETGQGTETILPGNIFMYLNPGESKRFAVAGLPFHIGLNDFHPNAHLMPTGPMFTPPTPVVDGYFLEPLPKENVVERNVAGLYARIYASDGSEPQTQILWGLQQEPVKIQVPEGSWELSLRKQRWTLPFSLRLEKFNRELYPGTNMPKAFSSEITRIDGDIEERMLISMNEPMRHKGYVFYQSSWGPQNAAPGVELFSVLAVSRNPADRFPLYACVFISLGMTVHFAIKLTRYLRRTTARTSA